VSSSGGDLHVWKKLYNLVQKVHGVAVKVGPADGENAEIGLIHEFGAPAAGIPARPFLKQTFERKRGELVALQAKIAQLLIAGKLTPEKAMGLLGAWAVGAIKATITRDGNFAPLKPATIKRKGSDKPLIDTGQLVGSITFVVGP
jgi:hypothetical protein